MHLLCLPKITRSLLGNVVQIVVQPRSPSICRTAWQAPRRCLCRGRSSSNSIVEGYHVPPSAVLCARCARARTILYSLGEMAYVTFVSTILLRRARTDVVTTHVDSLPLPPLPLPWSRHVNSCNVRWRAPQRSSTTVGAVDDDRPLRRIRRRRGGCGAPRHARMENIFCRAHAPRRGGVLPNT